MFRDPDSGIVGGEDGQLYRALVRTRYDAIEARAHGRRHDAKQFHDRMMVLHREAKERGLIGQDSG